MQKENCLAHPTVMIRADILKQYKYSALQQHIEDYDLWLRILSDGLIIEKVPQPLLYYRDHSSSVTSTQLKAQNPRYKNYLCKKRFLQERWKQRKWSSFESNIAVTMLQDRLMAFGKTIKQKIS
jgi:hypothetical protein